MASKPKCPECEDGAPAWMTSYGDMTTLLLCFFVFLLVTAKTNVNVLSAATGFFKEKIGIKADGPVNSPKPNSGAVGDGIKQEDPANDLFTMPVPNLGVIERFDKNSALLRINPHTQEELYTLANKIRGKQNLISIRGHASRDEGQGDIPFADAMDLSFHRARAVAEWFATHGKIRRERMRIVGCGYYSSQSNELYEKGQEVNRRVEVRQLDEFMKSQDTRITE